jgi:hypothetical protein
MVVQCQGCLNLTFYLERSQPGDDVEYDLYPSRLSGKPLLRDANLLPFEIRRIYEETRGALSNGLLVLAGIGIGTIIEAVCIERVADGKCLKNRIDSLYAEKLITEEGSNILHRLRDLRNEAAHEMKAHSTEELIAALDVIEQLLTTVYISRFSRKNAGSTDG